MKRKIWICVLHLLGGQFTHCQTMWCVCLCVCVCVFVCVCMWQHNMIMHVCMQWLRQKEHEGHYV